MLTKTEEKILETFVSNITKTFSIKQISEILKKPYPLIHRAIKNLLKQGIVLSDERKLLCLNYKENTGELAYAEHLRKKNRLLGEKSFSLFVGDCFKELKQDFFVFLVFGSFVEKKNYRDIDIIILVDEKDEIEHLEKLVNNIASNFSLKIDLKVISTESAYEMLSKREQKNVMNETLNKHILLFGAENYYRLLKNAR
jgi:predicted nucleotidyltransferase